MKTLRLMYQPIWLSNIPNRLGVFVARSIYCKVRIWPIARFMSDVRTLHSYGSLVRWLLVSMTHFYKRSWRAYFVVPPLLLETSFAAAEKVYVPTDPIDSYTGYLGSRHSR